MSKMSKAEAYGVLIGCGLVMVVKLAIFAAIIAGGFAAGRYMGWL